MAETNCLPTKVGRYFAPGNQFGFKKGESGNPGGRSKHLAVITALARELAPDVIRALYEIALHGSSEKARVAAAVALLDRALGRPALQVLHEERPVITGIKN